MTLDGVPPGERQSLAIEEARKIRETVSADTPTIVPGDGSGHAPAAAGSEGVEASG